MGLFDIFKGKPKVNIIDEIIAVAFKFEEGLLSYPKITINDRCEVVFLSFFLASQGYICLADKYKIPANEANKVIVYLVEFAANHAKKHIGASPYEVFPDQDEFNYLSTLQERFKTYLDNFGVHKLDSLVNEFCNLSVTLGTNDKAAIVTYLETSIPSSFVYLDMVYTGKLR